MNWHCLQDSQKCTGISCGYAEKITWGQNYIIRWDSVLLDENLSFEEEPVAILDREIRKLRSREIASIKVLWKNRPVEESTWEKETDMQEKYPHLFTDSRTPFRPCFSSCDRLRTNDG